MERKLTLMKGENEWSDAKRQELFAIIVADLQAAGIARVNLDQFPIRRYLDTLDLYLAAFDEIEREGMVQTVGDDGYEQVSSAFTVFCKLSGILEKLEDALLMTPEARKKMKLEATQPANPRRKKFEGGL
jgi:P27 family predicted phage terminase small subunit